MTARRVFWSLSVRGALLNRSLRGCLLHDDGREMTHLEAFDALCDELAKGRETIPIDGGCGNPCSRAGCAGFDYGKRGGCPGVIEDSDD